MKYKITLLLSAFVFVYFIVSAQETVVNPNTNITIAAGASLDLSNYNLVLKSDATGDASLIDFGTISYSGGGEAKVERYLTEGQWHLISSPVSNALAGMFLSDYLQNHSENSNGWTDIGADNSPLNVMNGYALWSIDASPTTEVFSGITNSGLLNRSFSQNNEGWNIMGNPYPSAIDWDAVTIPAELNGAIWLFDPSIGANGDYVYYINGGGVANTTSQYIPSGQGFFVRATGGAGTLTFDNDVRAHSSQAFYKDAQTDLLVLKATGNNLTTQTAIRFNPEASALSDRLFDVFRIISDSPDLPMLFTKVGTQPMAINTLPSIEENEIVPMWFRAGTTGKYTITATEMQSFDSETPIYIEEIQSGFIQNMRENPQFTFDYTTGSDKSFLIYFAKPENSNRMEEVKIYSTINGLQVNFPVSEFVNPDFEAQILLFDLTGRKVFELQTTEINNEISFKGNNNIYMVSVISGSDVANTKVFIK
ncbi:MAG: T9SS type A sorting domain-containing protein [Bacteroidales bacterium]|nr:T9SS type A sorting domain-containing protein [Bacteroidales bacterium]MCF8402422.1 T9SS type A sorting domain-containing protein [Bacteroidales bacterium]